MWAARSNLALGTLRTWRSCQTGFALQSQFTLLALGARCTAFTLWSGLSDLTLGTWGTGGSGHSGLALQTRFAFLAFGTGSAGKAALALWHARSRFPLGACCATFALRPRRALCARLAWQSLRATIALGTWRPLRAAFALQAPRPGFALKPASQL